MPRKPPTKEKVTKTLVDAVDRQTVNIERAEAALVNAFAVAYSAGLSINDMVECTGWTPERIRKRLGEAGVEMRRGRQTAKV